MYYIYIHKLACWRWNIGGILERKYHGFSRLGKWLICLTFSLREVLFSSGFFFPILRFARFSLRHCFSFYLPFCSIRRKEEWLCLMPFSFSTRISAGVVKATQQSLSSFARIYDTQLFHVGIIRMFPQFPHFARSCVCHIDFVTSWWTNSGCRYDYVRRTSSTRPSTPWMNFMFWLMNSSRIFQLFRRRVREVTQTATLALVSTFFCSTH